MSPDESLDSPTAVMLTDDALGSLQDCRQLSFSHFAVIHLLRSAAIALLIQCDHGKQHDEAGYCRKHQANPKGWDRRRLPITTAPNNQLRNLLQNLLLNELVFDQMHPTRPEKRRDAKAVRLISNFRQLQQYAAVFDHFGLLDCKLNHLLLTLLQLLIILKHRHVE
jgi:hypothetical protein